MSGRFQVKTNSINTPHTTPNTGFVLMLYVCIVITPFLLLLPTAPPLLSIFPSPSPGYKNPKKPQQAMGLCFINLAKVVICSSL